MNTLETFLERAGIPSHVAMDALQFDASPGVISDCCVYPSDVPESDCQAAIAFLRTHFPQPQTQELARLYEPEHIR